MAHTYEGMRFNFSERSMKRHFRFYYGKHWRDVKQVSRKTKKAILGAKLSNKKLKSLLSTVQIIHNKYPEEATILPYPFCPKCGCTHTRSTGNMSSYPERWDKVYCERCGYLVAESDNSPYVHVLELMFGEDKEDFDPKYWG